MSANRKSTGEPALIHRSLQENYCLGALIGCFSYKDEKLISRVWLIDETEPALNKASSVEWNGEYYISFGIDDNRSWKDAVRYGFISAGGGQWYTKTLSILGPGDTV